MITDFFSHKIHSSGEEWPEKLVELATIFAEFDNEIYSRSAIEQRLQTISPRASYIAKSRSAFRDEYSAYPAYFGLYRLRQSSEGWRMEMGKTTKELLLIEEPNTTAFLRLQLALFQYPNGMGAVYRNDGKLRLQANTRDRMLGFIHEGIHLSPLRLICAALLVDASLRHVSIHDAFVTIQEVYAIANQKSVNSNAAPPLEDVKQQLSNARSGHIQPPPKFEKRFHLLRHLDLFNVDGDTISLRDTSDLNDKNLLEGQIREIAAVKNEFTLYDGVKDGEQLKEAVKSGAWGEYFDALVQLNAATVKVLVGEELYEKAKVKPAEEVQSDLLEYEDLVDLAVTFPLRPRPEELVAETIYQATNTIPNPEITRIRRQRSNFVHKQLVGYVDQLIREIGAEPLESQHIDLCARIPGDGVFLFEMKSGGQKLIDQIRKGVSQLYEYRFRYREQLNDDVTLCLVIPKLPIPSWISEYLCQDRQICLCWFDDEGNIGYANQCKDMLFPLIGESLS